MDVPVPVKKRRPTPPIDVGGGVVLSHSTLLIRLQAIKERFRGISELIVAGRRPTDVALRQSLDDLSLLLRAMVALVISGHTTSGAGLQTLAFINSASRVLERLHRGEESPYLGGLPTEGARGVVSIVVWGMHVLLVHYAGRDDPPLVLSLRKLGTYLREQRASLDPDGALRRRLSLLLRPALRLDTRLFPGLRRVTVRGEVAGTCFFL